MTNTYRQLTPEDHLKMIYKCKVIKDGEKVVVPDPLHIHNSVNFYDEVKHHVEDVVTLKFIESDYNRFMLNYENYIDLIHGMRDPIIKDMFEKMMMYVRLRK